MALTKIKSGGLSDDLTIEFDSLSGTGAVAVTNILDEDNLVSNSATALATQQSIKAYVDTTVGATNEVVEDTTPQLGGDLDLNSHNITGTGTVDGRDVGTDGTKLDTVETNADVTDTANVTSAGALMDSELTSIASVKALNQGLATGNSPTFAALTSTGEIVANGGIALGDNDKATFGASDDLQIYHTGSYSAIKDTGTGALYIGGADFVDIGNSGLSETMARFHVNGRVDLYHDNAIKLATTATGIDVTGSVTTTLLNIIGDSKLGQDFAYFKSNSASNASLTLRKDSSGADSIDFLQLRNNGNGLIGKIEGDGDVSFNGTLTIDGIKAISSNLVIDASGVIVLDADNAGVIQLKDGGSHYGTFYKSGDSLAVQSNINNADIVFIGKDGGSNITALTLDMSNAGAATFTSTINSGASNAVGIGGTPADVNATEVGPGYINLMRDDASDVSQIQLGGNGVLVGSIGNVAANLEVNSHGGTLKISTIGTERYGFDVDQFYPAVDGATNLGISNKRFDDLFLSGQVNTKTIAAQRGDAGSLIQATSSSGNGSGIINFMSSLTSSSNNANCVHYQGTTQNINSWKLLGNGTSTWSSDINLKRDIETTRDGYLDDIKQLRVVKYKWKNDPDSETELGLIAQEVEDIFPSLVTEDKNSVGDEVLYTEEDEIPTGKTVGDVKVEGSTYKGVKYGVIPLILLKAIQEQQTLIESLTARISALEG